MPSIIKIGDNYVNLDKATSLQIHNGYSSRVTIWFGKAQFTFDCCVPEVEEIERLLAVMSDNTKNEILKCERVTKKMIGDE